MLVRGLRELLTRALNVVTAGMPVKWEYWAAKALRRVRRGVIDRQGASAGSLQFC